MRELDLSQFSRSAIGFDLMFGALESVLQSCDDAHGWPPYSIRESSPNAYHIELTVAGLSEDQLSVTAQQNVLMVAGKGWPEGGGHLGGANPGGSFERRFGLADFVTVAGATLSNGTLFIDLVRTVPKAGRSRRVAIQPSALPQVGQQAT